MLPLGFFIIFLLSSLRIYTNCTVELRNVVLRTKQGEVLDRWNSMHVSPVNPSTVPFQEEDVTEQPTSVILSKPINYADERRKIYPNFTVETSFKEYEKRLSQMLRNYSIQEQNCYRSTSQSCLSFNKKESSVAVKKFKEEVLDNPVSERLNYPQ